CLLHICISATSFLFFSFTDTSTPEFYTLSLHDALPICGSCAGATGRPCYPESQEEQNGNDACPDEQGVLPGLGPDLLGVEQGVGDRKSTRLNSSHVKISYAVFCLKKKKN